MINTNDFKYQMEQKEFFSDKCPHCMAYLNEDGKCPTPITPNC